MPSKAVIRCSELLAERNLRISFAESATAGKLSLEFALTEQSGQILTGSVISYDVDVKKTILSVPAEIIDQFTPESPEVTESMAIGLSGMMSSDLYVAVTGLPIPGGSESPEKPVGTMFFHIITPEGSYPYNRQFCGECIEILNQTVEAIAFEICSLLENPHNNHTR